MLLREAATALEARRDERAEVSAHTVPPSTPPACGCMQMHPSPSSFASFVVCVRVQERREQGVLKRWAALVKKLVGLHDLTARYGGSGSSTSNNSSSSSSSSSGSGGNKGAAANGGSKKK